MSKYEIHGKRKNGGFILPEGFWPDGAHPPYRVWNAERQDYLLTEFQTTGQAQEAINRLRNPHVDVLGLIRQVVEGATVQRRYKQDLAWEDVSPIHGIEMLIKAEDMRHLRIKPKTEVWWIACGDSGRLSPPRSSLATATQILYAEHGVRAVNSIRLELEPETFKVVSCTTEDT